MAEGGGLLNRYRINSPIVGSNPIPSASNSFFNIDFIRQFWIAENSVPISVPTRRVGSPLRHHLALDGLRPAFGGPVRSFL